MQVITNTRLVESRATWGKRLTWGGFLLIVGAIFFAVSEDTFYVSFAVMGLGWVVTNVGMHYVSRFGRTPLLEEAMKGLDNRYRLYNYTGPVDHVVLTPAGVMAITVRRMGGPISCKGDKWYRKTSLLSRLRPFGEDQLGDPSLDLRRDVTVLQRLLEAKLPDADDEKPLPIGGFIYFSDPGTQLTLNEPTVPVLQPRNMKDYLRKQAAGARLSPARFEAVATALGG